MLRPLVMAVPFTVNINVNVQIPDEMLRILRLPTPRLDACLGLWLGLRIGPLAAVGTVGLGPNGGTMDDGGVHCMVIGHALVPLPCSIPLCLCCALILGYLSRMVSPEAHVQHQCAYAKLRPCSR